METIIFGIEAFDNIRAGIETEVIEETLVWAGPHHHLYQIVFRRSDELGQEYAWKVDYIINATNKVYSQHTFTATKVYPKQVTVTVWK